MGRLDGRVAVVTGGARGIGRAIAERFLHEGALVVVWDRDPPTIDPEAGILIDRVDVAKSEDVRAGAARVGDRYGNVDILVNNAGINLDRRPAVQQLTGDEWSRVLQVNLAGSVRCVQAILPHMLPRRSGRIVNLSSILAVMGFPGQTAFAASKAGLLGVTRVWAHELGPSGITVNAVLPGYIDTSSNDAESAEFRRMVIGRTPLRKVGTPEDVAAACLFLVSEEARFLTGVALAVDGGLSA